MHSYTTIVDDITNYKSVLMNVIFGETYTMILIYECVSAKYVIYAGNILLSEEYVACQKEIIKHLKTQ